jgi:hypothetical protein
MTRCAISGCEQMQQQFAMQEARLLDHVGGKREHLGRNFEAERLGGC